MPPEPPPWDRKDLYKERKQERSELGSGGGRWRDSPHHGSRDFVRWGSPDFRRPPPGHGKQGTWHLFSEESGYGLTPSRSADKVLEDESCRTSMPLLDGKYSRSSRENRGKDWKGHQFESGAMTSSVSSRQLDMNVQRSADDMLTYDSQPYSDFVNSWDQLHSKDQHDKMGTVNGLGTGQRSDLEIPMGSSDWRSLKWTRSGSISSRGSGLSHSSSSRNIMVDTVEAKTNLHPRDMSLVQSPSGDAAPCSIFTAPTEETSLRKKQRLGWGEGLAKYEKKKVEGPDEHVRKNDESVHSLVSHLAVRSPRVTGFSDCISPATSSSVACSSSPGKVEKPLVKSVNVGDDTANLSDSPDSVVQQQLEEQSLNLDNLDLDSVVCSSLSIIELLQSDGLNIVDSITSRSTTMNKLLRRKADVLKALEMTEFEIDQLENELKSIISESESSCCFAVVPNTLLVEDKEKPFEEQFSASNLIHKPNPSQIFPDDMFVDNKNSGSGPSEELKVKDKNDGIGISGISTSEFVKKSVIGDATSPSFAMKNSECFVSVEVDHSSGESTGCEGVKKPSDVKTAELCSADASLCVGNGDVVHDILTSNKDVAIQSSKIFNNLLPKDKCRSDISDVSKIVCWQNDSLIKEKFLMKKRFIRLKERVLSLKFRALLRMWKKDLHLLSMRKYRAKSQKKIELSWRTPHFGFQKHRSSIRSKFYCPGGSSLVPTAEIKNSASKLLLGTPAKHCRDALKMPALILDKEKTLSRFISSNGLVEDPCSVEKERAIINPWTSKEKDTFIDKLSIFGKNFGKIASFLDHKTTADCVEFYYKNHKSDGFAKVKKLEHKKKGMSLPTNTYLLTPGKEWNRDMNAASLELLGAASVLAARADGYSSRRRTCSGRLLLGYGDSKASRGDERPTNFNIHGRSGEEAAAADALVGICGLLSPEDMNSCIMSAVDPRDDYQEWKYQKVGSVTKRPCMPNIMQNVDNETCSDDSCGEMDSADWTDEEKSIFVQAVSSYGKDFERISQCVKTRSRDQCKVFFSKARKCLGLDLIHCFPSNGGTPLSYDADRSPSDAEDACLLEAASLICCNKSSSKMDVDFSSSVLSVNHGGTDAGVNMDLQTALNISEDKNWPGNVDFENSKSRGDFVPDASLGPRDEVTGLGASVEELPSLVAGEAPSRSEAVGTEIVANVTVEGHETKNGDNIVLPKNKSSTDGQDGSEECDAADGSPSGQAGFRCSSCESKPVGDTSHVGRGTNDSSSSLGFIDCQPNDFSDLDCTVKHHIVSSLQGSISLPIGNAAECNSAAVHYDRSHNRSASSTTFGFEEVRVKRGKEYPPAGTDHDQRILQGLSLRTPTKLEKNGDVSRKKQPPAFHIQKVEKKMPFGYSAQQCYLQRCNGSKAHSAHGQGLSDTEKQSNNGDLRIFGKILTQPLPLQKETESKGTHESKLSSKFDQSNYLSLESLPDASNNFLDGKKLDGLPIFPTLVGNNGVGKGGISDQVAAMKMHYAKTDRLVGRVGREEEAWRDAADIGR